MIAPEALNHDLAMMMLAERGIENLLTKQRKSIYIACEQLDMIWDVEEVKQFEQMWREGVSLADIGTVLHRDPDEVTILCIDRIRCARIEPRRGGACGTGKREPKKKRTHVKLTLDMYQSLTEKDLSDREIAQLTGRSDIAHYKRKWRSELNGSIKGSQSRV